MAPVRRARLAVGTRARGEAHLKHCTDEPNHGLTAKQVYAMMLVQHSCFRDYWNHRHLRAWGRLTPLEMARAEAASRKRPDKPSSKVARVASSASAASSSAAVVSHPPEIYAEDDVIPDTPFPLSFVPPSLFSEASTMRVAVGLDADEGEEEARESGDELPDELDEY